MLTFVAALCVSMMLRLWLSARQCRHVIRHREWVPEPFGQRVSLASHRRAADYAIARQQLAVVEWTVAVALLLGWTLLGGLQWLHGRMFAWLPEHAFARQLALLIAVPTLSALVELPASIYRQLVIEERFGFNRMTPRMLAADLVKGSLVALALGVPLISLVLAAMRLAPQSWWIWTWLAWIGFNLAILLLYPTVIAPLFNRFEPLADTVLAARIQSLLARCGFAAKGLFVMDGSRRSAHGNAYFTGLGRSKRIVFFDTLLSKLTPAQIEAVLAHELGHFKRRHVLQRVVWGFVLSLVALWLLNLLIDQDGFFRGLGVIPMPEDRAPLGLLLFLLIAPVFAFPLHPLTSLLSRRHEYEADAFAAATADPSDLAEALVRLYEDNAATLTPDPLHSAFYDSHPPAAIRVGRLLRRSVAPPMPDRGP